MLFFDICHSIYIPELIPFKIRYLTSLFLLEILLTFYTEFYPNVIYIYDGKSYWSFIIICNKNMYVNI